MPAYKSYCWSLGTTSFRTVEFNRKIELQLRVLVDFWNLPQNRGKTWIANEPLQVSYYEYMRSRGFIEDKNAPRKAKDAREKTSGLVDLGLIDDNRHLTQVGEFLLKIAESRSFDKNNILQIPADSFVYFKQLLKLSYQFDSGFVRPYLVLAYMLTQLEYLTKEEFTYLLPLATSANKTKDIIATIYDIRKGKMSIDDVILYVLSGLDNFIEAQELFLHASTIDAALIKEIGMNRKSREYDLPYLDLYKTLLKFSSKSNKPTAFNLYSIVKRISGKAQTYWKQYLFNTSSSAKIERDGLSTINDVSLFHKKDEKDFRLEFFQLLHLFKAKSLLDDYFDLNRRYFKTTDTVLFQDGYVRFDVVPRCFFDLVKDDLLKMAFTQTDLLTNNVDLSQINAFFDVREESIFKQVESLYGIAVRNLYDIKNFVDAERYNRFNKLIDDKFDDNTLVQLMTCFENRSDNDIRAIVTNNADVPTIFEYILAIAWYKISGRKGKILDYMNLSLDADLLPITHAAGGHEDITYHYEATESYPAHTLLLEATLANSTNQRRMEMEPVSRHLGDYLLDNPQKLAYCVFATTFLHINVVSDFRMRKNAQYYSSDETRCIDGMKIIPCQTSELKSIISKGIKYEQLYHIFESAFQSPVAPNLWYGELASKLNS